MVLTKYFKRFSLVLRYSYKFLAGSLALILIAGMISPVFAGAAPSTSTKIIHLGYLQLAAHDFFDMNRSTGTDNENGKLDLSTVLFNPHSGQCNFVKSLYQDDGCILYDDIVILNGGEKRSVENIMISTASAEVGEKYLQLVNVYGEQKAYQKTLEFYHLKVKNAYEESFNLPFPSPRDGKVTNLHNLAIRSGHDFLPAKIMFNGQMTSIFMIDPLGEKLSEMEKMQPSSTLDGFFDSEFTGIDFCPIPPDVFCIVVDLLEADRTFGEQFGMGLGKFDKFMSELNDGQFNEDDEVSILIDEAFAIGINLDKTYPVAGDLLSINSSALLITGFTGASWIMPVILVIMGVGIYLGKFRSPED